MNSPTKAKQPPPLSYKNDIVEDEVENKELDAFSLWTRVIMCPILVPCLFCGALCCGQDPDAKVTPMKQQGEDNDDNSSDSTETIIEIVWWQRCLKMVCPCIVTVVAEDDEAVPIDALPSGVVRRKSLSNITKKIARVAEPRKKIDYKLAIDLARTDRFVLQLKGWWEGNIFVPLHTEDEDECKYTESISVSEKVNTAVSDTVPAPAIAPTSVPQIEESHRHKPSFPLTSSLNAGSTVSVSPRELQVSSLLDAIVAVDDSKEAEEGEGEGTPSSALFSARDRTTTTAAATATAAAATATAAAAEPTSTDVGSVSVKDSSCSMLVDGSLRGLETQSTLTQPISQPINQPIPHHQPISHPLSQPLAQPVTMPTGQLKPLASNSQVANMWATTSAVEVNNNVVSSGTVGSSVGSGAIGGSGSAGSAGIGGSGAGSAVVSRDIIDGPVASIKPVEGSKDMLGRSLFPVASKPHLSVTTVPGPSINIITSVGKKSPAGMGALFSHDNENKSAISRLEVTPVQLFS